MKAVVVVVEKRGRSAGEMMRMNRETTREATVDYIDGSCCGAVVRQLGWICKLSDRD
jgi:hypothetical protein